MFEGWSIQRKIPHAMDSIDSPVLVLNRLLQPVHICRAKRALSLLFIGHAEVVQSDEQRNFSTHDIESWILVSGDYSGSDVVRTVSFQFQVPSVIVLNTYDRVPRQEIKFSRQSIFERDKFTCQYCGQKFESKQLNLDHVIPREKGGPTTWENVVCSCIKCNTRKANKLPQQANMFPMNEPRKPRWRPFLSEAGPKRIAHANWRHFIGSLSGEVMVST